MARRLGWGPAALGALDASSLLFWVDELNKAN